MAEDEKIRILEERIKSLEEELYKIRYGIINVMGVALNVTAAVVSEDRNRRDEASKAVKECFDEYRRVIIDSGDV